MFLNSYLHLYKLIFDLILFRNFLKFWLKYMFALLEITVTDLRYLKLYDDNVDLSVT